MMLTKEGISRKSDGEEEASESLPRNHTAPPPNGGFRAWSVAVGAFSALICTFGYLNSFGFVETCQSEYSMSCLHFSYIKHLSSVLPEDLSLRTIIQCDFMDWFTAGLPTLRRRFAFRTFS